MPAPLDQYAAQVIRFGVSGGEDLSCSPVSFNTATSNVVVAAVAGQILRIYGMMLIWTSASNVQINQSTSAFTGTMSMLAGSSMMLTPNTRPYFVCGSGNPFRINSSTTASVTGCVWYRADPAP